MQEILRHRQVLVAACAGVAFSIAAIPPFVLSVFAGPMTREFGWTLQQFQWATFAVPLGVLIAAPVGGWLLDRYGPRRVALVGLAAFGASVAGLALSTAEPWTFYLAMLVLSLAAAGVLPTTWTRIINGSFDRQRGLALGITLSGSGIFATLGPSLAQFVIDLAGWRVAWLVLAALPVCVALPLVAAFIRSPQATVRGEVNATQGVTLASAVGSQRFWVMIASFGGVSFCLGGFNANLVPVLMAEGLGAAQAATLAGTLGLAMITGRIVAGLLVDRFWSPGVAAVAFSLPLLGAALLMGEGLSTGALMLCVALMGFAAGAVAFGRIRDASGSFEAAWPVVLVVCGIGAALQLALGRPQVAEIS
jgi:MFS family permease